jgi:arylsulfatase A-like enzyme
MKSPIRHFLAIVFTGLLAGFLLALVSTGRVALENTYLSNGFYRTIMFLLSDGIEKFALPVLGVAVVVGAVAALWYKFTPFGHRMLAVFLGLVPALTFFLKTSYDQNKLKYAELWRAKHDFLGVKPPEALFRSDVWVTNVLIFLVALAIGILVWLLCRRGLRAPGGVFHGYWRTAGFPPALVLMLALVLGTVLGSPSLRAGAGEKPNFIFVSLDALRYDHLGCYGYERDTSPTMDRLAAEGLKFDWAICQAPTTLPSHMSTLTSLYPTVHGCRMGHKLPGPRFTLPEYLRENGYRTHGCVDGGYMSAWYGFDQGFDTYDDRYKGFAAALMTFFAWLDDGHAEDAFFSLLHTYDIHSPYNPPEPYKSMFTDPEYDGGFNPTSAELKKVRKRVDTAPEDGHGLSDEDVEFIKARYDGGIRYVDEWVGGLMAGLEERGLLESTWVVLTADHGEEFAEHNAFLHGMLYMTVAKVPLIIVPPKSAAAGRTIDEIVELTDIMPTLLELAGVAPVDTLQGQSMLRLMDGNATGWDNLAFSEHHAKGGRRSVISPKLHVITSLEYGEIEVYDYLADPLEETQLADPSRDDEVQGLVLILQEWIREQIRLAAGHEGIEPAKIDQETIDELRSLGYIE